jgi:hypothetical protein
MVKLHTREIFFGAPYRAQKNLSLVFNLTIQGTEESRALYGKIKHKIKILLCPVW